ncbi:MAG: chorismate-binding protein [Nostocoides sp.]
MTRRGWARFGNRVARDPVEVVHDLSACAEGFWAVVTTFEGHTTAIRFADVDHADHADLTNPPPWQALTGAWETSLDKEAYLAAVTDVRERIAAGTVYQVNICRVLSHLLDDDADIGGLAVLLSRGNPAPYAGMIIAPDAGVEVVCASPELYLHREGRLLTSGPIKGTATIAETMLEKDYAENVMIVDLIRNDLQRVCRPGSVRVERLCALEQHPGLVHLVSTVSGELHARASWDEILEATFPPGSVSGAPKYTALEAIADLETAPRGPYCGAVGWLEIGPDQAVRAELAVGIRTFWAERDGAGQRWLRFGSGSGITWGSDPLGEWRETELKAARLLGLASGTVGMPDHGRSCTGLAGWSP